MQNPLCIHERKKGSNSFRETKASKDGPGQEEKTPPIGMDVGSCIVQESRSM